MFHLSKTSIDPSSFSRKCFRHSMSKLCLLQKRYPNRPIVEFEIAAQEQMKITELRLAKLFSTKQNTSSTRESHPPPDFARKVEGKLCLQI